MQQSSSAFISRPIRIVSERVMPLTPQEIGAEILRLESWRGFRGYGPLPGIRAARFRRRTPEVIGTQIEVTNLDGSSHLEEITEWLHTGVIELRMSEFSAPLSRLATHFIERWEFTPLTNGHRVARSFTLHPRGALGAVALRVVGPLMRRAVDRHLREMEEPTRPQ